MGNLFITRLKNGFDSAKFSKIANFMGKSSKLSCFNFKNCFNGLAMEYPMGFLFIARFEIGFKSQILENSKF